MLTIVVDSKVNIKCKMYTITHLEVLFCSMFYCLVEWEDKFSENWLARSKLRNGLFLSTCVGVCVANECLW